MEVAWLELEGVLEVSLKKSYVYIYKFPLTDEQALKLYAGMFGDFSRGRSICYMSNRFAIDFKYKSDEKMSQRRKIIYSFLRKLKIVIASHRGQTME